VTLAPRTVGGPGISRRRCISLPRRVAEGLAYVLGIEDGPHLSSIDERGEELLDVAALIDEAVDS
jgi:hypothetical protein